MTRLLWQAENKTVSMVHLTYKVQGGVRKADRLTMQEASRTSGFLCPRDTEQAPGPSSLWQGQLLFI